MLTFEEACEIVKARGPWDESKVKRDSRGRFARKADVAPVVSKVPKPRATPARRRAALDAAPLKRAQVTDKPGAWALRHYRGQGYQFINTRLRHPDREGYANEDQHIEAIDRAMERGALTADVEVIRGVTSAREVFGDRAKRSLKGAEWTEHAYVSTTADPKVANWFTGDGEVKLHIRVPAGTKGIVISDWDAPAGGTTEAELLLQRGLRMRVVGDTGPGRATRRIDVEVVPV